MYIVQGVQNLRATIISFNDINKLLLGVISLAKIATFSLIV